MSDLIRDSLGVAGAGKYVYQAGRAAQGLSTTTPLTAGLDLAAGTSGLGGAAAATEAAGSLSTAAKGVTGAARLSPAARVAGVAAKAAPVVAKGSAVLGLALGGYEVGAGLREGNRDRVISGGADMVTAGALGVAAVSSGTVVGLPVAAVALGVAGVAQAGKYAYEYRDKLADGASWVGDRLMGGASALKNALF